MSGVPSNQPRYDFDLPAVFSAAVDAGRVVSDETVGAEAEVTAHARLLSNLNPRRREFGKSRHFQLQLAHPGMYPTANTPSHFDEVDLSTTLPSDDARAALKTIASAVILLRGEMRLRTRGRELLGSGAWLLWQGMTDADRRQVSPRLAEAIRLWKWPHSKVGVPRQHNGTTHTETGGLGSIDLNGWRPLNFERLTDQADAIQAAAADGLHRGQEVIDWLFLGGDERVEVTGLSCLVILGTLPTVCPNANPPLPPTVLPEVIPALRRLMPFPEGLTIHWVGHTAGSQSRCQCFPGAPTAAPSIATAGRNRGSCRSGTRWPVN